MSDQNQQQPGLVSSHAQYVHGAVNETVGSVTGSEPWKTSGQEIKASAVDDMKKASEGRDPGTQGYGKAEEIAGKVAGCEGMEQEGEKSKSS